MIEKHFPSKEILSSTVRGERSDQSIRMPNEGSQSHSKDQVQSHKNHIEDLEDKQEQFRKQLEKARAKFEDDLRKYRSQPSSTDVKIFPSPSSSRVSWFDWLILTFLIIGYLNLFYYWKSKANFLSRKRTWIIWWQFALAFFKSWKVTEPISF
jgi:hypothetical protein